MSARTGLLRLIQGLMMKHLPGMITCAELEAFIADYLDGRLAPREKWVFELHLKLCRECRSYLEAYRRSVELGQRVFRAPDAPVREDVPEDLVQAILAARGAGGRRPR